MEVTSVGQQSGRRRAVLAALSLTLLLSSAAIGLANPLVVVGRVVTEGGAGVPGVPVMVRVDGETAAPQTQTTVSGAGGGFMVRFDVELNVGIRWASNHTGRISAYALTDAWVGTAETNRIDGPLPNPMGPINSLLPSVGSVAKDLLQFFLEEIRKLKLPIGSIGTNLSTEDAWFLASPDRLLTITLTPLIQIVDALQQQIRDARQSLLQTQAILSKLSCVGQFAGELLEIENALKAAEEQLKALKQRDLQGSPSPRAVQDRIETRVKEIRKRLDNLRALLAPRVVRFEATPTRVDPGGTVSVTLELEHLCGSTALQTATLQQTLGNAPAPAPAVGVQFIQLAVARPKAAGRHSLQVLVTDQAGQQASGPMIEIEVRNVPPRITAFKNAAVEPGETGALVQIEVEDDNAETPGSEKLTLTVAQATAFGRVNGACDVAGSGGCAVALPRIKMPLMHGALEMTATVKDRAGGEASAAATLTVKNVKPEVAGPLAVDPTAIGPTSEGARPVVVSVSFTDRNGSDDLKGSELRVQVIGQIGGIAPTPPLAGKWGAASALGRGARFEFTVIAPKSGTLQLRAVARDGLGEIGESAPANVPIQNLPPLLGIVGYGYGQLSATQERVCPGQLFWIGASAQDPNGDPLAISAQIVGANTSATLTDPDGNGIYSALMHAPAEPGTYTIRFTAREKAPLNLTSAPRDLDLTVESCPIAYSEFAQEIALGQPASFKIPAPILQAMQNEIGPIGVEMALPGTRGVTDRSRGLTSMGLPSNLKFTAPDSFSGVAEQLGDSTVLLYLRDKRRQEPLTPRGFPQDLPSDRIVAEVWLKLRVVPSTLVALKIQAVTSDGKVEPAPMYLPLGITAPGLRRTASTPAEIAFVPGVPVVLEVPSSLGGLGGEPLHRFMRWVSATNGQALGWNPRLSLQIQKAGTLVAEYRWEARPSTGSPSTGGGTTPSGGGGSPPPAGGGDTAPTGGGSAPSGGGGGGDTVPAGGGGAPSGDGDDTRTP